MEYPDSIKKQRVNDHPSGTEIVECQPLNDDSDEVSRVDEIIDVANLFCDDPSGSSAPPPTTNLPPCKYFQAGYCSAGSACHFSHVKFEAVTSSQISCVFFAKGKCTEGDRCRFSHTEKPKASSVSIQIKHPSGSEEAPVCRYFVSLRGCKNPTCPFKHIRSELEGLPRSDLDAGTASKILDKYSSSKKAEEKGLDFDIRQR